MHGNPNVLTRDVGTSALAQGCTGQLTTVEVERFDGNLPPIQAYDPPVAADIASPRHWAADEERASPVAEDDGVGLTISMSKHLGTSSKKLWR